MNDEKNIQTKNELAIKNHLAEHLGVDIEDLSNEDYLKEDLHMNSVEISDFLHLLIDNGININLSKITEIQSVQDIIDVSTESEEF